MNNEEPVQPIVPNNDINMFTYRSKNDNNTYTYNSNENYTPINDEESKKAKFRSNQPLNNSSILLNTNSRLLETNFSYSEMEEISKFIKLTKFKDKVTTERKEESIIEEDIIEIKTENKILFQKTKGHEFKGNSKTKKHITAINSIRKDNNITVKEVFKYGELQLKNVNNGCHQDTFIKMMEEISRKIDISNFIHTEIEKKINYCLKEANENENESFKNT